VLILAVVHRPAHHELAVRIDDQAHIELALLRHDFGDIGNPLRLRLVGGEIAFEPVLDTDRGSTGLAAEPALPAPWPALQGSTGHQAGDPIQADALALIAQVFVHAWAPITPLLPSWISRMRSSRRASACARGPGLRPAQA
jgi:hypothetical protein